MDGYNLDNKTIINNMGGDYITEDGIYIESAYALGNTIYAYPNRCGRAEAKPILKSLSQITHEDERLVKLTRDTYRFAITISLAMTAISVIFATMSKNTFALRIVIYFWISAYLNGFVTKSAMYYGGMLANWSLTESKKYYYAYSKVMNCAREKNDIPTYEEAVKASPYAVGEITGRFAKSFCCIITSIADSIVLFLIAIALDFTMLGNQEVIVKIILAIAFILAGGVLITLHKGFISDWVDKHKTSKIFIVLAEKPFQKKAEYKHYNTAILALEAHCVREKYIAEHEEEYQVAKSIIDFNEGKMIFTLVNGNVAVIYL